jgi:hypothetical protein
MLPRHAGKARLSQRFYLTDRHGAVQEEITPFVTSATVDFDVDRPVSPLLLRGELRVPGLVMPYRDTIQPWLRLEYPNGFVVDEPLGLYAVAPPQRRHTFRSTRETFEGRDHTWRLATSFLTGTYTAAAGANVVQTVIAILHDQGFSDPDIAIDPSGKRLVEAITWGLDQTVSWLEIANTLLAAIAYTGLHTKRQGPLRALALPDLETAPPNKVYTTDSGEVTQEVSEDPKSDLICNVVRVINERDGTDPILAIAENHNPASPVSIENLDGRRLFREIRDANIPDQETAEAIALRTLQEGATYDNRVTITTALDPTRNPHEIYEFALARADSTSVLSGRWRCTGWSLGMSVPNVTMTHQIGKVAPV